MIQMQDALLSPLRYTNVRLQPPNIDLVRREDGSILLTTRSKSAEPPRQLNDYLHAWARKTPERVLFGERGTDGAWRTVTFEEAADKVNRISQGLLSLGLTGDSPIASLGDNSINMALLQLGAMQVGIPFMPISPAYSLMSQNFAKLKHVFGLFTPAAIHVPEVGPFAKALDSVWRGGVPIITDIASPLRPDAIAFDRLSSTEVTSQVAHAYAAVNQDTIAKILLTSGSTGMPKGVINTQRMMCTNGLAVDALWAFITDQPPVLVDWLPWNHTFGGNHNFNLTVRHGGTLWIDDGRPTTAKLAATIRNLRDHQPTMLFNVPRGFEMLLPALEGDEALLKHVFEKVDIMFYAGAALPAHHRERLDALSVRARGARIPIMSALGSTETSPFATVCHWPAAVSNGVGLPIPDVTIKLVPSGGKSEMRVKGPNVTPGYYRQPEQTATAFDDEGYFMLGDAVRFIEPDRPEAGLQFDGRISENFKLTSGTWVNVGEVRLAAISAAAPFIQDAVVTGHDRDEVGLLAFVNVDAAKARLGDAPAEDFVRLPELHERIAAALRDYNADNGGSSRRIARVLLMTEPPSVDGNEITDKGYLNQRAILERRAELVSRLYDPEPAADRVIVTTR